MSTTKQKSLKLRILVLDDEISSASGFIFNEMLTSCFQDEANARKFSLTTLQGKESEEFQLIPSLNFGEGSTSVSFMCNLPSKKSVSEVKREIINRVYPGEFDLILLDDNWGEKRHGGQDELLSVVYENVKGPTEGLPIIVLFTQHWEEDRIKHLFEVAKEFDGAPVIPANKTDPLQVITLIWRALILKHVLLQKKTAMDAARELEVALRVHGNTVGKFPSIIGTSKSIDEVRGLMARLAKSKTTVLLNGESGTGKELVAAGIHFDSDRKNKPYITVNCGAIPENLIESELFGYEKGAFTGANSRRLGRFEDADCGTLFLDEIAEMPLSAQVKLLRILENGELTRLGGNEVIKTDVRIIAATNANLEEAVETKKFRFDLHQRLDIVPIYLPPLRDRGNDIALLAAHFLEKQCLEKSKPDLSISGTAMAAILAYAWPGNVRELENAIERAVVLCDGREILPEHLPPKIFSSASPPVLRSGNEITDANAYMGAFQECIREEVVTEETDKRYQLLRLIFEKAGSAPTPHELDAIGLPKGSAALRQAASYLRNRMESKRIRWTISPRLYRAQFLG